MRPKRIPYEEVAQIVREWPTLTGYAPHIAERWGVPVPTAHRWVYQARLRGLLPNGKVPRPCQHCNGTGVKTWGKSDAARPMSRHAADDSKWHVPSIHDSYDTG